MKCVRSTPREWTNPVILSDFLATRARHLIGGDLTKLQATMSYPCVIYAGATALPVDTAQCYGDLLDRTIARLRGRTDASTTAQVLDCRSGEDNGVGRMRYHALDAQGKTLCRAEVTYLCTRPTPDDWKIVLVEMPEIALNDITPH